MRTLAEDTHETAGQVLLQLWRAASPARKIALLVDANRTARALAMAGLRERHPRDCPELLRHRLADLWLGPKLAAQAYGRCQIMSEGPTELLGALVRLVSVLEGLGVDYFVGGSLASSVFGEPRQTLDADLVARLLEGHVAPLVERLSGEFYIDRETVRTAVINRSSFNLVHLETMAKMDVFVASASPYTQAQFERRQSKNVGISEPVTLFFASPEDTVLAKLDWYRKGGCVSDRQWRDVLGILMLQSDRLERTYLRRWAKTLEVADLLDRALTRAGLPPGDA